MTSTQDRRHLVPLAALVSSLGLLIQCIGYSSGWLNWDAELPVIGRSASDPGVLITLFYLGLVVLTTPWIIVLTRRDLSRRQRVLGALLYAWMFYLSWMLLNPVMGNHFDENLQTATTVNLLRADEFFTPNSMLPVSARYLGLALAAAGLQWATGVPLMVAQVATVMLARLVLVLALYGLILRITRSDRAAGVGLVLYVANPQFYFFDAQFNYDTIAVALAVLTVRLVHEYVDVQRQRRLWLGPAAVLSLACLSVTHHLGSWITVGLLWAWAAFIAVATMLARRRGEAAPRPSQSLRRVLQMAVVGTVLAAAWFLLSRDLLVPYLRPLFERAIDQLTGVAGGGSGGRELFADTSGGRTPLWEQATMLAASALWCLALVPPVWLMLRGRLIGQSVVRFLPWGIAAVYPILLLVRVSPNAAEIAVRASAYVMLPVVLLVGAWWVTRRYSPLVNVGAVIGMVVMTVGGLQLGAGADWLHRAGPFIGAGQARAVDHNVISVARWTQQNIPPGSRIAADNTLARAIPDYARVTSVTLLGGSVNVSPLFADKTFTGEAMWVLSEGEVDFVYVDTRLADSPTPNGTYYESSDLDDTSKILPESLAKFHDAPGFKPVLEEGPIEVYDVRALRGEAETFVHDRASRLPGPWNPIVLAPMVPVLLLFAGLAAAGLIRRAHLLVGSHATVVPLFLAVPMALGAAGFAAGYRPWVGVGLTVGTVVLGLVVWQRRQGRREASTSTPRLPTSRVGAICGVLAGLVVLASIAIAVYAAWHGLIGAAVDLPPPPSGS